MTLLVLEQGAEWPSWAAGLRTRALHSAVEVQAPDEPMDRFMERIAERLEQTAEKGRSLMAVGYVCALHDEASGEDVAAQRLALCQRLLSSVIDSRDGELVVAGGAWEVTGVEGAARQRLIELWSRLTTGSPRRTVSVRFESPQSESGIFPAAAPSESSVPSASSLAGRDERPPVTERSRPRAKVPQRGRHSDGARRAGLSSLPPPVATALSETWR